ncbi:hybrid sensor histidine kinase/response regulator transcription factor [Pelobium manganitolerans]|uniref:hybrid sensor histidine kinase/response regulator transcription factor n=1 Tax=Pelobium manganitolerans TaxID=1842495 RepID=UPI003FA39CCE
MFLRRECLLFVFFLFVAAIDGFSQERTLNFMNISSQEGLSANNVSAMLKDRYGYMWFATDDGLNRFDGQHFTVYRHIATDASSIASNEIVDLYEDQKGQLWVATGLGLVSYDRSTDSFIDYPATHKTGITSVTSDHAGKIWISAYDGISVLNPDTKQIESLNIQNEVSKKILTKPVIKVFIDTRNRVWVCSGQGLYQYLYKTGNVIHYPLTTGLSDNYPDKSVQTVYEDQKGNLWLATANGLSMLRADGKGIVNYKYSANDKNSINSNVVYAIAGDQNGEIWVGTEEGLSIVNPGTKTVQRIERSSRNNYGLRGKAVKSILIDKQGIYWVATFRTGVNKYDKNLAFFNLVQSNRNDPFGLNSPVVSSFVQANEKSIYVGTDGGGLSLFDVQTGVFHQLKLTDNGLNNKLSILAMEKVKNEIWIGTYLEGLFIYNTKTGYTRQIKEQPGPGSLSGNNVFCIKHDSRGNVWVGTNGQGVNCYDLATKKFGHFNQSEKGKNKININGYIRSIEEDSKGNIWIGTSGSGIAVYNPITERTQMFSKTNNQLASDNVTNIYCAKDGVVYIGSAGGGLTVYEPKYNSFRSYSEQNGLANGIVYKILEDNAGKIWMSTNKGISSFDPETKKIKNYYYDNGIQRSPFVMGAGLKTEKGTIFFGGTDGINFFNPELLYVNKNVPSVVFTDLKIGGQTVEPSKDGPIHQDISIAKDIYLDYKQNFSLSFVALNYTSPQENRYLYKLEKFDKEWVAGGNIGNAVYTNLDPGDYVLKVKSISDSGAWASKEIKINIHVSPPFWLSYYAYFIYLLVILGILYVIRYFGIQKLKTKFAIEQERINAQRLIADERREAERKHEFDQLKINFLTNISHEFRTPISLIIGPIERLLQIETVSDKHNQLKMVRRNARRLLNLVNQLLDFRNIKLKEQKLNLTKADFVAFMKDVADSFSDLADRRHVTFQFKSELKNYFAQFDQEKLERVFFNILSNAFKFTAANGSVLLEIRASHNLSGVIVTVADDGVGMDEATMDKVFDRFFTDDTHASVLNQGTGIGLSIAKEFVQLHQGNIEVSSIPGKGTEFSVLLPFEQLSTTTEEIENANFSPEFAAQENDLPKTADENKPLIVVVEDNADFRDYLSFNLRNNYNVVTAVDGEDGWKKILSSHPALVISDINMPHLTGTQLCEKIKTDKRTQHIPTLLLTALNEEEDHLEGLNKGADDYMSKPFNLEILNAKIRNLLLLNQRLKLTYSKRINVDAPQMAFESENEKLLNKVLLYIESNLTNSRLSVEDLSKHVGMSRGSLYSKILELTGESPVNYIRSIKLAKAAVMLEKSELNVSQISYEVGFAAPNYFARAFKLKYNMLPSEYAAAHRNQAQA